MGDWDGGQRYALPSTSRPMPPYHSLRFATFPPGRHGPITHHKILGAVTIDGWDPEGIGWVQFPLGPEYAPRGPPDAYTRIGPPVGHMRYHGPSLRSVPYCPTWVMPSGHQGWAGKWVRSERR